MLSLPVSFALCRERADAMLRPTSNGSSRADMRFTVRACLLLLALCTGAARSASAPDAVISTMTERVLAEAASAPQIDVARLNVLVESMVMPNVDFSAMTARVVGPRWREASDEQKQRLMAEFEALLVRSYAGALAEARGANYRLKSTVAIDAQTAEVRSEVKPRGREPIALHYRLELRDDGWKVIDVGVMGVWLVPTYRSQFAPVLGQSGIDGLLKLLAEKSRAR
jgi:phospholipid transport system substrate-binding protein